jgi:hypothetical protein
VRFVTGGVRGQTLIGACSASIKFTANGTASMQGWLRIVVDSALQWGQEGWGGHIGANNLINVTPLLNLTEAQASLSQAAAYARAYGGTVVIENLPSWNAFFSKYVPNAQSVSVPSASRPVGD